MTGRSFLLGTLGRLFVSVGRPLFLPNSGNAIFYRLSSQFILVGLVVFGAVISGPF